MRRPRVLTWHVHGSYLFYLTQARKVDFYLPKKPEGEGYGGRAGTFAWGDNVIEIPAEKIKNVELDAVIFQSRQNYLNDQYEILSEAQRKLPKIYIEHDPPREHPTDTRHSVDDPSALLVHVTAFNNLMWDSNRTPTKVIDHGVTVPPRVQYTGEIAKGIVVINNIKRRGRRLGLDVFEEVRRQVPLDVVGMGAAEVGGLGEIPHHELAAFTAKYRFFFNPIRYTSLGLAVCEAMMAGLPVVGLATTEMATAIRNGYNGYVETDTQKLIPHMQRLLDDVNYARRLSNNAQHYATRRFGIKRFAQEWEQTIYEVIGHEKGRF